VLGADQSHYNQSRRWSWLHTTLAKITRIAPKWITLYWKFFHRSRFEQLALALKKNRVALKIFTVVNILFTFRIFNSFRLLCKQIFPWKFSLYWIYFLLFRIFEQRRFLWKKQSWPEIFHCIEYTFYIQEFWATCVCSEKQSCPGIFHCIEYVFFIIQDFWATCACPEKNRAAQKIFTVLKYILSFRIFEQLARSLKTRVALKIFTVLNVLFRFRIFEQLALALKNRVCPGIFHCIEYVFFIIQDFWAACACPEKNRVAQKIFAVLKYILSFRFFEQLARSLKTRVALKIFTVLNILLHSGFLSNLRLPWKTQLPRNFSLYWIYFLHSGFLRNLRLPWKTDLPRKFSLYLNIFYHSGYLGN